MRQEGLGGQVGNGITVNGVEIDHNNFTDDSYRARAHNCGDEAGGFKWVSSNVTVKNSNVHDNACKGLWTDLGANGITISGNTVANNWDEGIFIEISQGATTGSTTTGISHNTVIGNGFNNYNSSSGCSWGWGGGITISTSGQIHTGSGVIEIQYNDVERNCNGITGVDSFRNERSCDTSPLCELANVNIHDNKIVGSTASIAVNTTGAYQDDGDNLSTHNLVLGSNSIGSNMAVCTNWIC
jgi:hypothetical protein